MRRFRATLSLTAAFALAALAGRAEAEDAPGDVDRAEANAPRASGRTAGPEAGGAGNAPGAVDRAEANALHASGRTAGGEIILRREDGNAPIPGAKRAGNVPGKTGRARRNALHARPRAGAGGMRSLATGGACLGLVLLGIVGLAWLFKRFAPGTAAAFKPPCLEVLGRTFLDRQRSVYLLRVGERVLVVGCSNAGLERLAEINDPEEAAQIFLQTRAATKDKTLGRNPLGLLGRRKRSFLRSLHEAVGDPRAGVGSGMENELREPELETARVQAPEEGVAGRGLAALQGEAVRLRQQLEAMRRTL